MLMKNNHREEILSGDTKKVLLSLAWPIIAYNVAEAAFNFADAFFLGRLGPSEFSAPLAGWSIIMIFNAFANGLISGGLSIISRIYGSGSYDKIRRILGNLVLYSIILYLPLGILPAFYSSFMIRNIIMDSSLAFQTSIYVFITLIGILPSFIFMSFYYASLAVGDTKTPSKFIVFANLINIALDPVLIYGVFFIPGMGVMGAAIAGVVAHTIVLPFFIRSVLRKDVFNGFSRGELRLDKSIIHEITRIGLPIGLQNASTNVGQTLFVSLVSRFGVYAVAALNVSTVIFNVVSIITYGFNRALSSVIGICLGARRVDLAHRYWRDAFFIMTVSLLLVGLVTVVFSEEISMFLLDDEGVLVYSRCLLFLIGLTMPFFGWIYIAGGVSSGSGDTWPYLLISVLRLWVLRIGVSYILYYWFDVNINSLWLVLALSNLITGLISILWVIRGDWSKKEIRL